MGKILEAFANDNILPCTRYFDQSSEYGRALDQLVSTEKSIRDSLDDTTKALFTSTSNALQYAPASACVTGFIVTLPALSENPAALIRALMSAMELPSLCPISHAPNDIQYTAARSSELGSHTPRGCRF